MMPEILMLDRIGGAYSLASLATSGLGGSEIEVLQVAKGLTAKGHSVVVANGVDHRFEEEGITFVPHAQAWQHRPTKALYLQRFSTPETRLEVYPGVRMVVRANDVYCPPYDVHKGILSSGRAALVANTHWQANQFSFAKERAIIPPILEPMPKVAKKKGVFVFASGAMKGLDATLNLWCELRERHERVMRHRRLVIVSPGWGAPGGLTGYAQKCGVSYLGCPTPENYRQAIASAEGLFMVLTMPETFCCAAALAERAGTRTHILCRNGVGGLRESVQDQSDITESEEMFRTRFIQRPLLAPQNHQVEPLDLLPSTVIDRWAETLHVDHSAPIVVSPFPDDPTLAPNQAPMGPFFGEFLSHLRTAIAPGGSEFGAGLMLFSLASSIQAREIVEIGRFKGFSTLALAGACHLQTCGWADPVAGRQRPDVDYVTPKPSPRVVSIDPVPLPEATALLRQTGLESYVQCVNLGAECYTPEKPIDLLFVDGRHDVAGLRDDLQRFVPWVRSGGYFILHDYYGWFTADGQNGSPIAQVIAEDLTTCDRVLIDTTYASLVIFRKTQQLTERWELPALPSKLSARADGRPTVGLVIIAKGDEASTVATRAIVSGKKAGVDCITLVCDAQDATADVARSLGADVFIRPTPVIDWAKGIGVIAGARNEALAIAERRTDYLLMLDADDWFEGTVPATFDHDAYEVTITDGSLQYQRTQLFRSSLGWRYSGIIHEVLGMAGSGPVGRLTDLRYLRGKSSYGYQDRDVPSVKYAKHAHLARKWLMDHPDDTRAQFYLARSYQDAGQPDEAINAYEERIRMAGGWDEERVYSAYQIGLIQSEQGQDPTVALLRAHALGPHRAEPLVALARWYRDETRRQFSTAYAFARHAAEIPQPVDGLFLIPWVYQFEAAAEVAIAAYWLGRKQEALERFEELLPRVPAERRKWAEEQIAICIRDLSR